MNTIFNTVLQLRATAGRHTIAGLDAPDDEERRRQLDLAKAIHDAANVMEQMQAEEA